MTEKIRYELVPDELVEGIAQVFMAGITQGYDENGWKEGKAFEKEKNIASIKRHLADYRRGMCADTESGLHPLLHAATRSLMQYYLDLQTTKTKDLPQYDEEQRHFNDLMKLLYHTGGSGGK